MENVLSASKPDLREWRQKLNNFQVSIVVETYLEEDHDPLCQQNSKPTAQQQFNPVSLSRKGPF